MATLRNRRLLTAFNRDNHEDCSRSNQLRKTIVPRVQGEYITQLSEEIEGRMTKKLSKEFNRTQSRILANLSELDEFLVNPQVRVHFGSVPETSRISNGENQGTNED